MAYNVGLAVKLLEVSLKYDDLWSFLVGGPGYELNAPNGYGVKEQNTTLVMQAIYTKYQSDPSVAEKLEEALEYDLGSSRNGSDVIEMLNIIKYQLSSEKVGSAPFKIDCEKFLSIVKENIIRNKELYLKYFSDLKNGTFMGEFKNYDDYFKKGYGIGIL